MPRAAIIGSKCSMTIASLISQAGISLPMRHMKAGNGTRSGSRLIRPDKRQVQSSD